MAEKKLHIVSTEQSKAPETAGKESYAGGKTRRMEAQAYYDRRWLVDPESFDPTRNCMERERIARTMELIRKHVPLDGVDAADLGCGSGLLAREIRDGGAAVDAVDISANALKLLKSDQKNIRPIQDYVPCTTLSDDAYDLVSCTELIAELRKDEYRLLFSELARIVKHEGWIVCSTAVDIDSDDALQRFGELAETEIQIKEWRFSHHRCYIRFKDILEAPERFARAGRDHDYRLHGLDQRASLSRWWFRLNSGPILTTLWGAVALVLKPLVSYVRQNRGLLLGMEKMCRFFWSEAGISHAILIGKRIPLAAPLPKDEIPKVPKHKKQVWE